VLLEVAFIRPIVFVASLADLAVVELRWHGMSHPNPGLLGSLTALRDHRTLTLEVFMIGALETLGLIRSLGGEKVVDHALVFGDL
jgi:hypothetical protein